MKIQVNQVIDLQFTEEHKQWIVEKLEDKMKDMLWKIMKSYAKYEFYGDAIRITLEGENVVERVWKQDSAFSSGHEEPVEVLKFIND